MCVSHFLNQILLYSGIYTSFYDYFKSHRNTLSLSYFLIRPKVFKKCKPGLDRMTSLSITGLMAEMKRGFLVGPLGVPLLILSVSFTYPWLQKYHSAPELKSSSAPGIINREREKERGFSRLFMSLLLLRDAQTHLSDKVCFKYGQFSLI